jgi:hypothetical protein
VRRTDMVRDFAQLRFSPRPRTRSAIRKYVYQASLDYVENGAGRVETRTRSGEFALDFRNADRVGVVYSNSYEYLPRPFAIGSGVTLPVGAYGFNTVRVNYNMGQQRRAAANLSAEVGTFYSGRKTTLSAARGRMQVSGRLSAEPTYSYNHVDLEEGRFVTHLAGSRVTYTMTPLMFVSALLQYSTGTHTMSSNVRVRWEYRPGSELFVVYNEERDTLTPRFPAMSNRALIVKVNRLFRF